LTCAIALDNAESHEVTHWDHAGRTYAVYPKKVFGVFTSDGQCTDGQIHPTDCLFRRHLLGSAKHGCTFDIRSAPRTYPSRVSDGLNEVDLRE
jgi:nitrite reductase/ring-hydroxylating ferredoxin subunit